MENGESGYSRDEIFAQLKKLAEEEEEIYSGGKQLNFDFTAEPVSASTQNKSDVGNGQQSIDEQAEVDFDKIAEGQEDPIRVKKLWHGTQGLITSNISKGKTRNFTLNEKNLFLKATANTTDSKFTFTHAVQTVFDMAERWIQSNADAVELGMTYWDLNERNGFHSKKRQNGFSANLKALLKVPPPQKDKKDSK